MIFSKQKYQSFGILVAGIILFFSFPHGVHAISVSPPVIEAPQVLRGMGQKASTIIGRIPSEVGELTLSVSTRGEFASYILFEPTFIIPAGELNRVYEFTIDGATAPVGTYQVPMTFSLAAAKPVASSAVGQSMSVITGATIFINFTVTGDQIVSYTFDNLNISAMESDDAPILEFSMTNTGNVDWKPQGAKVILTNIFDAAAIVEDFIPGEKFSLIAPGESSRQNISLSKILAEGSYKAVADISYADGVVGTLSSQEFTVVAPGSLLQAGSLMTATAPKSNFDIGSRIPVNASFLNTGEVPLRGVFTVEVSRDGTYEDIIVGDEFTLGVAETADLSVMVSPKGTGEYSLKSYVKFANRKSNSIDVVVNVSGTTAVAGNFANSPMGIAVIIGAVLFVVLCLLVLRRMRSHRASVAPTAIISAAPIMAAPIQAVPPPVAPSQPAQSIQKPAQTDGNTPSRRW